MNRAFGEIKTLRLPKKLSPGGSDQHRGFAFVDFHSKADAKVCSIYCLTFRHFKENCLIFLFIFSRHSKRFASQLIFMVEDWFWNGLINLMKTKILVY